MTSLTDTEGGTPLVTTVAPSERINLVPAVTYALISLLTLWACGGGHWAIYHERLPYFAILALIVGLAATRFQGSWARLQIKPGQMAVGLGVGLASFVPFLVASWIVRAQLHSSTGVLGDFSTPSVLNILTSAILLSPALELSYRGVLAPLWGAGSAAFLEALNFGFGLQNAWIFGSLWILGYLWSFLDRRFGLPSAIVARVVWALLLHSCLRWL